MNIATLPRITASHLVKSVDLNHHGTLFAGRMAEWLVETGFMTARAALDCPPGNIVCVRLHGMDFRHSVAGGETVVLEGQVAHAGSSSVTVYVTAHALRHDQEARVDTDGYATFVHLTESGATPHGLEVEPPDDPALRRRWDHIVAERRRLRERSV